MKNRLFAGVLAAAVLAVFPNLPAEAGCSDSETCVTFAKKAKTAGAAKASARKKPVRQAKASKRRNVAALRTANTRKPLASTSRRSRTVEPLGGESQHVVALIKTMAPAHGVPTWFALKIAKVESNYNPRARGRAGELGVFQLKCNTAKGIGYRGGCSGLLDPRTNVQYGLRHLSLAMQRSGGNLRLAASKHNGGLGRRTEVRGYVAKVF